MNHEAEDRTERAVIRVESVFLHVTKACNLRCRYCYYSADRALPNELCAAEFDRLWPELVRLQPKKVVFTGGEPLLRPDLFQLLEGLCAVDVNHVSLRCLNTNGHLVTPAVAKRLVGLVDEVRVSIDAMSERNDRMRGAGNFSAALAALETLHAVGFEPKVLVTLMAPTLPDLTALVVFLVKRGFPRIGFNGMRLVGRGADHSEWRADSSRVREALRAAYAMCYSDRLPQVGPDPGQDSCGVGRMVNIMSDGRVYPCHVLTQPEFACGDLRSESLTAICHPTRLLGQLARLSFQDLAARDEQLSALTRKGTCLGHVYSGTQSSSAWQSFLPIIDS